MKKVLIYRWNVFNQKDIQSAMNNLGYRADIYEEPEESKKEYYSRQLIDVFMEYDFIFSVNFFRAYRIYVRRCTKNIFHGPWTVRL